MVVTTGAKSGCGSIGRRDLFVWLRIRAYGPLLFHASPLLTCTECCFEELDVVDTITPKPKQADAYAAAYKRWRRILTHQLNAPSDHD